MLRDIIINFIKQYASLKLGNRLRLQTPILRLSDCSGKCYLLSLFCCNYIESNFVCLRTLKCFSAIKKHGFVDSHRISQQYWWINRTAGEWRQFLSRTPGFLGSVRQTYCATYKKWKVITALCLWDNLTPTNWPIGRIKTQPTVQWRCDRTVADLPTCFSNTELLRNPH